MVVPILVAAANAAPRRLPQQRQGALAWMNFEARPSDVMRTGVIRLITHSIQADTLLSKYLPKGRAFLLWANGGCFRVQTRSDLDLVLADYFELGGNKWAKVLDWCANIFFGLVCCFPTTNFYQQGLVQAWRRLAEELGVSVGPPHDLKHSGAARTLFPSAGRWRRSAVEPAERLLARRMLHQDLPAGVCVWAALPPALLREGAQLARERGPRTT